jgi:hypothetical protein
MLPTVVPAATEKLNVVAALVEPMACEPKFWLAAAPVYLICADPIAGCHSPARINGKIGRQTRRQDSLPGTNSKVGIMATSPGQS